MVEDCSPYPFFRSACRDQAAVGHSSGRYRLSRRSSGVLRGVMSVSSLSPKLGSRYCAIESSR